LAVTDVNLILGRLIPDYFPKIFGPLEDQPLDVEASRQKFEVLAKEINYLQEGTAMDLVGRCLCRKLLCCSKLITQ
jgi:N-methylhydantoinase A/oxoprolinase/acetone carboxylase beta subunit